MKEYLAYLFELRGTRLLYAKLTIPFAVLLSFFLYFILPLKYIDLTSALIGACVALFFWMAGAGFLALIWDDATEKRVAADLEEYKYRLSLRSPSINSKAHRIKSGKKPVTWDNPHTVDQ